MYDTSLFKNTLIDKSSQYQTKAIGPFSTSSSASIQQLFWMIVTRKSICRRTWITFVEFHGVCQPLGFFWYGKNAIMEHIGYLMKTNPQLSTIIHLHCMWNNCQNWTNWKIHIWTISKAFLISLLELKMKICKGQYQRERWPYSKKCQSSRRIQTMLLNIS